MRPRLLAIAIALSLAASVGTIQAGGPLTVVEQYAGPDSGELRGLAWDGSTLWSVTSPDGTRSTIYKHTLDSRLSAASYRSPSAYTTGIAWISGRLWSVDNFSDRLVKHSASMTSIESDFGLRGRRTPDGIAWTGTHIWVANENALQKFDSSANFIEEIVKEAYSDLTYIDGFLLAARGGTIYKLNLDSSLSVADTFSTPGSNTGGLAWDGRYLWVADITTNRIYRTQLPGGETQEPSCSSAQNNSFSGTLVSASSGRLTVVITHGWQERPFSSYTGQEVDWVSSMRSEIDRRLGGQVNVVTFTWEGAYRSTLRDASANVPCHGSYLGNALLSFLGAGSTRGIQFIGHSLGTVLNAEAAGHLARNGVSNIQFTVLEAPIDIAGPLGGVVDGNYFKDTLKPRDAFVWVDNYYGTGLTATGAPISGAYNHAADGRSHSGVHDWYRESIRTSATPYGFQWSIAVQRVSLRPSCPSTQPVARSVAHAASYASPPITAGQFLSIFGCGLGPTPGLGLRVSSGFVETTLDGTRVLFDGQQAPLIYVSDGQINAIVPFGVAGKNTTEMVVERRGVLSNSLRLPVAQSAPGVFTQDYSGSGAGLILNQDYTLNSARNPARLGSVVMVFIAGGGQTNPTGIDGLVIGQDRLPRVDLPVEATIGGIPTRVDYAGAAPGFVSGLVQVNVLVPLAVNSGDRTIVLRAGPGTSQAGVTLAVR